MKITGQKEQQKARIKKKPTKLYNNIKFTKLKWPPQSPDPKEQLWDVVEWEIRIMDQICSNCGMLSWFKYQNLWGMFPEPYWICAIKD